MPQFALDFSSISSILLTWVDYILLTIYEKSRNLYSIYFCQYAHAQRALVTKMYYINGKNKKNTRGSNSTTDQTYMLAVIVIF